MTSKLKPYPKYKDSGIQWIGKIPEGWEVNRLKFLLSSLESGSRETGGGSQLDEGVFSLGGEHINWDGTLNLENTKLISEEYYNSMNQGKLKINDILLVKDGATIGKTAILKQMEYEKMAVNEHVFLMRPNKRIKPKLLYYLICSDSGFRQIKLTETGSAQGGVNQDFKGVVSFTISPEIKEQNILINFLDKKTAKIDALIEKDKKLIELLKEKRTALINHAVTKGLDPDVKLKDSGIGWIGKIPEGWEVKKIKFVSNKVITGKTPPTDNYAYYDNGNINWFTPSDLGNNLILKKSSKKITPLAILKNKVNKYNPNTVLLVGIGATLGKVGIITDTGTSNQQINAIEFNEIKLYSKYGLYYLYGYKDALISLSNASTIGIFNQTQTANFIIIVPPLQEQTAIANFLDNQTSKIDKTIKLIENKIKLLEEYKKSLIHYVVTGKVDVRGVEA